MVKLFFKLSLAILVASSQAWGQLTPEQLKLKEELLKGGFPGEIPAKADPTEHYDSPLDFSGQDPAFYTPPDGGVPPAEIKDKPATSSGARPRIFGYNMFDGSAESFSPVLEATPPPDYKLGPGDNILVNIWGRLDMQLNLTVDREGTVFVPKAGEIPAWGVTLDDFRTTLDRRLSSLYTDYQLSVTLGKIRRIKVFVYGEVKRPGGYTTSSLATLFNALYLAGGPTDTGSLRKIRHLRGNKVLAEIDLYRFLIEGDNSQDDKLESGDVIFVPVTGPLVSISGQVKRPAIYEMLGGEKVSDLIVLAGGTNAEAFMEKISIDRVGQDDNRVISDIDLSERLRQSDSTAFARADLALRDGDRVDVPSIFDLRENTVRIMGNVKHPGVFGLRDSMRVSDLIDHGQQIRDNSYLERANLFRIYPDLRREVYTVNIAEILAGVSSSDFLLMDRDSLVVYAQHDIKRNMTVTVFGAVKHPGMYSFYANMHLSDLVFLAGNPLKQTYLLQAEIARTRPGKPAEIIHANLEEALAARGTPSDVTLCEDDRIFIFTVPRYREDNTVSVEGEVMFPGTYALMMENERLSDVLARCGGFTPDAFKEGLVFMRGSITDDIEKRHVRSILASTEVTVLDSLNRPLPKLGQTVDVSAADRIIIDIDRALKDYDSPDNILLRRGDRIFVPAAPAGVQVLGAVAMNGTVIYKKNKLANYFIKSSGGFSRNADKGQTRLAKPDGRVFSGYRAFQTAIEPGDIIIVPQKVERHKSWLRLGTSAAAIASSLLTGMLIADRLR